MTQQSAAIKQKKTLHLHSKNRLKLRELLYRYRFIYLLMTPGILFFIIFKFAPMAGLLLAFVEYSPYKGFSGSEFIGLKYYKELFGSPDFFLMLRNTLCLNLLGLVLYFPLPIILSIMINEIRSLRYKRVIQSIVYMPHFMSWVVIASLTFFLFSADVGLINKLLHQAGMEKISVLTNSNVFWIMLTGQTIWREMGWGTILILASITGIDTTLYEAAVTDGAGRFKQILHITLPGIMPTIVTLLILRVGNMADVSLEQISLMRNPLVLNVAEVFDTYAFNQGVQRGLLSLGVAVGSFKSVINLIMVFSANHIIKKLGQDGIF